jgi:hypothetical protein
MENSNEISNKSIVESFDIDMSVTTASENND